MTKDQHQPLLPPLLTKEMAHRMLASQDNGDHIIAITLAQEQALRAIASGETECRRSPPELPPPDHGKDLLDSPVSQRHPASAPSAPCWLPINSAPRDGSEVLVWIPSECARVDFGRWDNSSRTLAPDEYDDGRACWRDNILSYPLEEQPTHWMPLPAPPSPTPVPLTTEESNA